MHIKKQIVIPVSAILLAAMVLGCGGAKKGSKDASDAKKDEVAAIIDAARKDFDAATQKLKEAEKAGWDDGSCKSVARKYEKMAKEYDHLAEAQYNAGVVYLNCGVKNKAKEAFETTVKHHPQHQLALTQLAVMALEKGDEKKAEELLRAAVAAGANKIEAVPAYVNAATVLRGRAKKGEKQAFEKAQGNLRRALAIDSKYMPALYQLSLLYLDIARAKGRSSFLTLATLVCNQAIALNPEYGPIYHALGLNMHQPLGNLIALHNSEERWEAKQILWAYDRPVRMLQGYEDVARLHMDFSGTLLKQFEDPGVRETFHDVINIEELLQSYAHSPVEFVGTGLYHPVYPHYV